MSEPIIEVTPEEWDAQYRAGQWDYLKGITAHYAVIGSMARKYGCGSALDVGCGRCLLREFLVGMEYMGLEISIEAVQERAPETKVFMVTPEESVKPPAWMADCCIFCESLYYMPDPLEVLARYFGFCKIIFLSIMISDKTAGLIRSIQERFTVVDDFQLASVNGGGWEIMAVKP